MWIEQGKGTNGEREQMGNDSDVSFSKGIEIYRVGENGATDEVLYALQ